MVSSVTNEEDRLKNLQKLGFPIEKVIATSRIGKENPKKKFIEELNSFSGYVKA